MSVHNTHIVRMHAISDFGTSVPAFLAKLWKLVEDPKTDDLICWSPVSIYLYLSLFSRGSVIRFTLDKFPRVLRIRRRDVAYYTILHFYLSALVRWISNVMISTNEMLTSNYAHFFCSIAFCIAYIDYTQLHNINSIVSIIILIELIRNFCRKKQYVDLYETYFWDNAL